jgi:hypothetical protein
MSERSTRIDHDDSGRLGLFARLPRPHVDGALDKATFASDTLRASGVILVADTHGRDRGAALSKEPCRPIA